MRALLKTNTYRPLLVVSIVLLALVTIVLYHVSSYMYPTILKRSEAADVDIEQEEPLENKRILIPVVDTVGYYLPPNDSVSITEKQISESPKHVIETPSLTGKTSTPGPQSVEGSKLLYTYSSTTPPPPFPTFHPSKELFIRAIYFDGRPRNKHKNSSVFLVVVKKDITDNKLILGCQVDKHVAKDFEVRLIGETPLWRAFYPKINHEEAFIECFDLPARNGSMGYITFKRTKESEVEIAATERPLYVPGPRIPPSTEQGRKYGFSIASCAKIFNHPPWMKEWLQYQATLGVQHVHLDVEDSFVKNGGLDKPYMKEAIEKGFLSVDVWNSYLNGNEIWYHNQGLIYEDCVYRFLGVYDYLVLMDTDDFLTPRVPGETQLYYYINKYCRGQTTGSCKFKWIEFFPDHFGLNESIPILDGNVTRRLNNYSHYIQGNPKSMHRINVVVDAATHYAYKMLDGFQIKMVSSDVMYVAHVRKGNKLATGDRLHVGIPHSSACYEHVVNRLLFLSALFLCLFVCSFT